MKKFILPLLSLVLAGCTITDETSQNPGKNTDDFHSDVITWADYGAFLGRSENNVKDFDRYQYVSFEFDEFDKSVISDLNSKGVKCFAYLNVGSLESYRSYYDDYYSLTFLDYENWNDERWIDVTNTGWQDFVVNTLGKSFKNKGATGVYLDNVDIYSVFKEEKMIYSNAATALCNIITNLNNLGLKVMMNGGAEFIDDMNDQGNNILKNIWAYHQEEVFSLIEDYDHNIFGKQNAQDKTYYQDMAKIMKQKGAEIFFLEYTKDENLVQQIDEYCSEKNYHYCVSKNIDLK